MAAGTWKIHTRTAAFTMAEMLVAIAIMGILLTAIATAFNASAMNYRTNSGIAEAVNSARGALARMTSLIRTGQPSTAVEAPGRCSLMNAGQSIVFWHDAAQRKLYYVVGGSTSLLCDNVTGITFSKDVVAPTTGPSYVKSVTITMTVQVNGVTETFVSAAVCRLNL